MSARIQNLTPVPGLDPLGTQARANGHEETLSAQKRRGHRLRLAVLTSLGSKFASLGLQFLAIPIAVRSVTTEEFGVYTAAAAVLSFISLGDLGLGPALTRKMARAWATGDQTEQSRLFGNALIVVSSVLVLAALGVGLLSRMHWFNAAQSGSSLGGRILLSVFLIGGLQLLCNPFIRAQAGFQQMHIGNLFGCIGAAVAAGTLSLCAYYHPSPVGFLWSVYGCTAGAQLLNAGFVILRHPYLRTEFPGTDWPLIKSLLQDGIQFALPQTIGPMLLREGPKILLIAAGLAVETAKYGVLTQLMLLAAGSLFMFTQPLFPALVEAETRGDLPWAQAVWRRGRVGVILFALGFSAGFLLLGSRFIQIYTGGKLSVDRLTLVAFCSYAVLMYWNHLGFVFSSALGHIGLFFKLALVELTVMGLFLCLGLLQDTRSVFFGLAASLLISAVVWPRVLHRSPAFAKA